MTKKLYDTDSYLTEFDCKVVELYSNGENLAVVTDATAFFPEGGGQTSDRGYFNDIYVKDVQLERGKIMHIVENSAENVKKLQEGSVLRGKIDFKKRFSDMQQHTGEHIFSGVVHSLFGFDNVGFHLGSETVTLDFNGELTNDNVCKVERLVNNAVWDNLEIRAFFPSESELASLSYRSKKEVEGPLRLVEIPGVDLCACCAPHVKRTGEIGLVEVVSFERYKGGTRLNILCGERALYDIRTKLDQNHEVGKLLSAKETETLAMVQKLKSDREQMSFELSKARLEALKLRADAMACKSRTVVFCEIEDTNMLREYADLLSEKSAEFAAVLGGEDGRYKYVIITKSGFDLSTLCKKMNSAFAGRGGGRNGIVQGSLAGEMHEVRSFLEEYCGEE